VQDREQLDHIGMHTIDQPIRRVDELANLDATDFGDDTPRLWKHTRLVQPTDQPLQGLLGVTGEARLMYSMMPAICATAWSVQRIPRDGTPYEARRMRERMLATASSWLIVRPASASASPASIEARTYTSYARSSQVADSGRPSTSCRASGLIFRDSLMTLR